MVSDTEIDMIVTQLHAQGRKWKVGGKLVTPTRDDIRTVVQSCVETIREDEGSISVEIGGVLVKRTEEWIDIYVHVAELEYDEPL